jgi:hypothetical protein
MSMTHAETPGENLERPMKDAEFIDLIEHLRQMQEKANVLAVEQLELTQQLETAFKKARALHRRILEEQQDVGGEA